MARLVEHGQRSEIEPLEQYMCYWVGLNNICITVGHEQGWGPEIMMVGGRPQLEQIDGFTMPQVRAPSEREQLEAVFKTFSQQLKETLVLHKCTRFFVNRLPRFQGHELTVDARGQRLNGVLSIGETVTAANPVWSPIDHAVYYAYLNGQRSGEGADKLARQILGMLYTIGKNLFHGGRRVDDASDINVVEHALPLLKEVVGSFVRVPERRATPRPQPSR
jgi:hypothetical protein